MNITEMLMKGKTEAADERPKATFRSKRLAKICGVDGAVEVELTALTPRNLQKIRSVFTTKSGDVNNAKVVDANLLAIVDAVTNPDMKDEGLRKKFGCVTPKDLAEKLFGEEINALSSKIIEISEPDEDDEELAKN